MSASARVRVSLIPLLILTGGTASRCELSTESGTGEFHLSGTIHFVAAEGGCWRLEAEDGRQYELRADQAPASVLQDGAIVRIMVEPGEAAGGLCRAAVPVEVRRVLSVRTG